MQLPETTSEDNCINNAKLFFPYHISRFPKEVIKASLTAITRLGLRTVCQGVKN